MTLVHQMKIKGFLFNRLHLYCEFGCVTSFVKNQKNQSLIQRDFRFCAMVRRCVNVQIIITYRCVYSINVDG